MNTEKFNKLPIAKRRVLIIKDVLFRLKTEQYRAETGDYLDIVKHGDLSDDTDLKTAICADLLHCTVCARGALFMSTVAYKNELTIYQAESTGFKYDHSIKDKRFATAYMSEFSFNQQALIETAFEGSEYGSSRMEQNKEFRRQRAKAKEFRSKVYDKWSNTENSMGWAQYILTAICKNIIKNKGTFKP